MNEQGKLITESGGDREGHLTSSCYALISPFELFPHPLPFDSGRGGCTFPSYLRYWETALNIFSY